FMRDDRIERPYHADLEEPQADFRRFGLVDSELVERLADVEIALAGRDDADLGIGPAPEDDLIQAVGAGEGNRGQALVSVEPPLLLEPVIIGPDIETV